jgi:uroporphyrin-III C-methyltransferase
MLRSGQERAELAGDYSAARVAFRRAYRLLRESDDPRASRARGLVAQELEALEAMSEPDWTSMTARIDRLVAGIDEWPAVAVTDVAAAEAAEVDETAGWWARMGSTLAGLVRVQPRDAMPVTAEDLDLVREQVRLRLTAVELAIARRDLEESSRQLRRTAELIERWFDTDHSVVARSLDVLGELAATEPAKLPDLGGSLAEIQRLLEDS